MKPENKKEDRKDRRLVEEQTGKRQVVVVIRERGGKALPFVFGKEVDAIPTIKAKVATGTVIHADEASGWNAPARLLRDAACQPLEGIQGR